MSTITYDNLVAALNNELVLEMKQSHPYTTKETISRKVLKKCANILTVDLNSYKDKNLIFIHPSNIKKIDLKWQSLLDKGIKIQHDEHNIYKLIKSSELVNIFDIQKFINFLSNKREFAFLEELLCIDGFQGFTDYKSYIDNLAFGEEGSDHVSTLRQIYNKFNVEAKMLHLALLKIYDEYISEEEMKQLVYNNINELETQTYENLEDIMQLYKESVQDLETIALTKLVQLKIRIKKGSKRKTHKNSQIDKRVKFLEEN